MKLISKLSTKSRDFQPVYLKLNQLGLNDPMFQNIKKRLGNNITQLTP